MFLKVFEDVVHTLIFLLCEFCDDVFDLLLNLLQLLQLSGIFMIFLIPGFNFREIEFLEGCEDP